MANPYFNAEYYLARNPDVFAAGINTAEAAWEHYVNFGAAEALNGAASRKPAPWFDIAFYLADNPDLNTAGLTAGQLLDHFTNFGISEGRSPNAEDNVDAATMSAYAVANPDLVEAFDIEDPTDLTDDEVTALAQHFYAFGYNEDRPGLPYDPSESDEEAGQTFTLTAATNVVTGGVDDIKGTAGDDVIRAVIPDSLNSFDTIDGGAGDNTLTIGAGGLDSLSGGTVAPVIKNVQTINNADVASTLDLANVVGVQTINSTAAGTSNYSNAALATVFGVKGTATTVAVDYAGALAGTSDIANFAVASNGTTAGTLTVTSADAAAIDGVVLNVTGTAANTAVLTALTGLKSIVVEGDGNITVTNAAALGLTSFDASEATGTVSYTSGATTAAVTVQGGSKADVLDFSAATATSKVTIDGGAGNDTILVGAGGSSVTGGAGADSITLGAGVDTVIYTTQADSTYANFDSISGFATGTDKIDLSALNLTAQTTAIQAGVTSHTTIGGLSNGVEGFFGTDTVASFTDTSSSDIFLMVDVNGDGNFTADADLVILTGTVAIGDLVFA